MGDVVGYYDDGSTEAAVDGAVFGAITPTRVLDTRIGLGIAGPVGDTPSELAVAGVGGVPTTGVTAVVINVTVTRSSASSFLTVFPTGTDRPNASNLNFAEGETIPNLVVATVGDGGRISIANAIGTTDVVGDVVGYFTTVDEGGGYRLLPPSRVLDTRIDQGISGAIGATPQVLTVAGHGGVPTTDVSEVVINVTATRGTANSFLTLYPTGAASPGTSNLNFAEGETIANLVVAAVDAEGRITIANANGTTDVVGDVVGYYTAP